MITKTTQKHPKTCEIVKPKTVVATVKASKINTIIFSIIITFIIGYITYDYFVIKHKIENKIVIVNQKFDSLQLYLDNKIPQIDNALKIQEQQVKDLQQLSSIHAKK